MTQARGSSGQILIQKETTYKTAPTTPATKAIPFTSESLRQSRNLFSSNVITTSRNPTKPARGNIDASGSIVTETGANIGLLFEAVLGSNTTIGAGPYTHTMKVGDLSSFLIEKGFADIDQYFLYLGAKVSSMSMDITSEGFQEVTFNFMAASESASGASYETGTPATYDKVSFDGFSASIKEGGATIATVASISGLTFDNGLDGGQYFIGGAGVRANLPDGIVKVSGTLNAMFENLTLYTKAIEHTESSLEITFKNGTGLGSAGNESFVLKIPELVYAPNAPIITGPTGVLVELPFEGYYTDSVEETSMQIIIKNSIATL